MEGKSVPKKGRPCQEPGKGKTFPIKIYKVLEAPAEDEPLEKPTNVKGDHLLIRPRGDKFLRDNVGHSLARRCPQPTGRFTDF
ncbi:hypothetical protein DPEC_G00307190 [Dallia pectoralis]|uniref:Uncharacterized protein n=1 Tax=Dallia pectoralis TaxID=75939 RepID=A0ACC2FE85_DALPE|nr:hypothetical protein DPEC_G00307190 [Dallia pectoralis]